jgi:NAD(P)-dependent dehydrogenase (short-subunit alcohol dehydrogenase family)
MNELHARTAVVTGGASGIGRALVDCFAAEGMNVVVADVRAEPLEQVVTELTTGGHRAIGVPTDVSQLGDVRALAAATLEEFGAVHVVCNNAGVVVAGRVEDLTDEEWRWVVDVDLWGVVNGVRVFLPLMEQQGEGHLVSTASTSGLVAPPFISPYSVSKAGVVALMEALRRELDERSSPIGASVLVPGPVKTAIVRSGVDGGRRPGARSATEEGRAFVEDTGAMLAEVGKEPVEVAAMVVEAIRANRFWILTHPEWVEVLQRRLDAMATTGALTTRPGASDR